MFKQDLAMAYFPDNSKETASKRFANEIHSNKPLLAALQATGYSRPPPLLPLSPKKSPPQTPNNQPHPKTTAKNFQFPCYFFVIFATNYYRGQQQRHPHWEPTVKQKGLMMD